MEALIKRAVAPLKRDASFECETIDEVLSGYIVDITGEGRNGWYPARTRYGYEGYICGDDIDFDGNRLSEWERGEKYCVNAVSADMLCDPCARGRVVDNLTKGCYVKLASRETEDALFAEAESAGTRGFIRKKFLSEIRSLSDYADESAFRYALVAEAEAYAGAPYRWGGKTPLGIDCSGLCAMAYMLCGVIIYRDAVIKEGFPVKEIGRGMLKKGDLLFFPGHVGMYVGEGRFIHSSSRNGGVAYNSLIPGDAGYSETHDRGLYACGSIFDSGARVNARNT